jgi:hypothetical protein
VPHRLPARYPWIGDQPFPYRLVPRPVVLARAVPLVPDLRSTADR